MTELSSHISVIFSADIVGYTFMMQQNQQEALSKLQIFEETISVETNRLGGEIIKSYGDGCLVLFQSAVNAVQCAINIQNKLQNEPRVPLRIGIHIGEIVRKDKDVFGNGVNVSSRIESMGIANSILVSSEIYHQIKNIETIRTFKIGLFQFSNVDREIELFAITNDGLSLPSLKEMKGKGKYVGAGFTSPSMVRRLILAAVAIIIIAFGLDYFGVINILGFGSTQVAGRIAVLPFTNMSADPELEYLSDGITLEIINYLDQIGNLNLAPYSMTVIYKGSSENLQTIATALNVSMLLTGSSRIDEDSILINVELVNPETNERIWSDQYRDIRKSSLKIQTEIARSVVDALNIKLSKTENLALEESASQNVEIFEMYNKAKYLYGKSVVGTNFVNSQEYATSVEILKQIIKTDPSYRPAYSLLAWIYWFAGTNEETMMYDTLYETIDNLVDQALQIDDNNSIDYLIKAGLRFWTNEMDIARSHVEKSIALNSWPEAPLEFCLCIGINTYLTLGDLNAAEKL